MIGMQRYFSCFSVTIAACAGWIAGCNSASSPKQGEAKGPMLRSEPADSGEFIDMQFERIKNAFLAVNVGRMLIQKTHPSGSYVFSDPPQLVLSADKHQIIGKVTVKWTGGVTKTQYETDFTIEITKDRVRLTTERDTALFQIEPNQLRLAELELTNIVRPLQ
jgi:hypothetical protein